MVAPAPILATVATSAGLTWCLLGWCGEVPQLPDSALLCTGVGTLLSLTAARWGW